MYQRPEDALPPDRTECIVIRVRDDDEEEPGKFLDCWLAYWNAEHRGWAVYDGSFGSLLSGKVGWWMERPRSPAEK